MSKRTQNLLLACISLLSGACLYAIFRCTTYVGSLLLGLPLFQWMHNSFHHLSSPLLSYYLPDLLWCFSFCSILNAIYLPKRLGILVCGAAAILLGILWEAMQYSRIVSGTGDLWDILTYLLAALLSTIINLEGTKHEKD